MNNMTDKNKVIIKRDMLFFVFLIYCSVKGQCQFTLYVIGLIEKKSPAKQM